MESVTFSDIAMLYGQLGTYILYLNKMEIDPRSDRTFSWNNFSFLLFPGLGFVSKNFTVLKSIFLSYCTIPVVWKDLEFPKQDFSCHF